MNFASARWLGRVRIYLIRLYCRPSLNEGKLAVERIGEYTYLTVAIEFLRGLCVNSGVWLRCVNIL